MHESAAFNLPRSSHVAGKISSFNYFDRETEFNVKNLDRFLGGVSPNTCRNCGPIYPLVLSTKATDP